MASLLAAVLPAAARADGGLLRLAQPLGAYRVAVFTDPTPLRAGPIDVSVLVQDAATGAPVLDVPVVVTLTNGDTRLELTAGHAGATNKLLYAAATDLPDDGTWQLGVEVGGAGRAAVDVEAAPPAPRWRQLWPWFSWPAVPILLFALHEVLTGRRVRRGRCPATSLGNIRAS